MNAQQERVLKVLERLADIVRDSEEDTDILSDVVGDMLDELHGQDFFGTEGQNDPRGDFRDGDWSMFEVEGVD